MSEANGERKKESTGTYVFNVILCMLFPFVVLWYGPKYLLRGEYAKGLIIILVVGAELIIANSVLKLS